MNSDLGIGKYFNDWMFGVSALTWWFAPPLSGGDFSRVWGSGK